MKKIKYLSVAFYIIATMGAKSQTVTYNTEKNESNKQNLMVNVSVLDFNLGQPTLSLGAGADADLYMGRFSAEANFHFAYWDGKKGTMKATNESLNKLSNFSSFRLGGRFHFIDRKGSHSMKAITGKEYVAGGTITHFLPMVVPCRSIVALHFGVEHYNAPVKGEKGAAIPGRLSVGPSVIASDGTQISEWGSGTNLNVFMLYGGLSFVKILKTTMAAGRDKWLFNWYRHAYIDVLYAPIINIQNIMLGTSTYVVEGAGTSGFEKNAIGARFGMNVMNRKKMSMRYELGVLPGLAGRGIFTTASFGFPILKEVHFKKLF